VSLAVNVSFVDLMPAYVPVPPVKTALPDSAMSVPVTV
jgi:hypothetical protein